MRIAHLADLHLGRVFHAVSLLEDQRFALVEVLSALREARVDAVVLAGDLYDRALPGSEAVRLFDEFLKSLREELKVTVIAIAGNHDSADHLGFGAWMFSQGDVHLRGRVERECTPITLSRPGEGFEVTFYPLPYIDPESARGLLDLEGAEALSHRVVVSALLDGIREHIKLHAVSHSVVIAHGFVQGSTRVIESRKSERSLFLGGLGAVPASAFEGFTYSALGHLHRPQSVTEDHRVRYAGSLLKYSFDEREHTRGFSLVEIDARGGVTVEHVPLSPRRELRVISGSLDELLTREDLRDAEGCFVSAELSDHPPPLQAMERLRQRFPFASELRFKRPEKLSSGLLVPEALRLSIDPESLFRDFCERVGTGSPDASDCEVFREALKIARTEIER